jgi:transketolase N-terminal domain/subunit
MYSRIFLILLLIFSVIMNSCEQNPAPADDTLELEPLVAEQAAFGWEVNRMIASGQDIVAIV